MNQGNLNREWMDLAPAWIKEAREGENPTRSGLLDKPMLNSCGDVKGLKILECGCGEGVSAGCSLGAGESMSEPRQSRMIVCLADISGFAKSCEGKSDFETFAVLNEYYDLIGSVIGKANGTIVKFMGDAAIVVFPEDKARGALASLRELVSLASGVCSRLGQECTVRFKAHVGSVLSGPMGPDNQFDVVGNTMNQLFLMPWDGSEISEELITIVEQ